MNELERQLTQALSELSTQYKTDMTRLEERNKHLSMQVSSLSQQVQALNNQLNQLEPFLRNLAGAMVDLGLMKSARPSSGG